MFPVSSAAQNNSYLAWNLHIKYIVTIDLNRWLNRCSYSNFSLHNETTPNDNESFFYTLPAYSNTNCKVLFPGQNILINNNLIDDFF